MWNWVFWQPCSLTWKYKCIMPMLQKLVHCLLFPTWSPTRFTRSARRRWTRLASADSARSRTTGPRRWPLPRPWTTKFRPPLPRWPRRSASPWARCCSPTVNQCANLLILNSPALAALGQKSRNPQFFFASLNARAALVAKVFWIVLRDENI